MPRLRGVQENVLEETRSCWYRRGDDRFFLHVAKIWRHLLEIPLVLLYQQDENQHQDQDLQCRSLLLIFEHAALLLPMYATRVLYFHDAKQWYPKVAAQY